MVATIKVPTPVEDGFACGFGVHRLLVFLLSYSLPNIPNLLTAARSLSVFPKASQLFQDAPYM